MYDHVTTHESGVILEVATVGAYIIGGIASVIIVVIVEKTPQPTPFFARRR
jgi:hypothetical protein